MSNELSPEILAQLEQLRDIRLPDPIAWWPLAPGWWALAGVCLLAVFVGFAWSIMRRRTIRFAALKELQRLRLQGVSRDLSGYATEVSALLRRVAIRRNGRSAGLLNGGDWVGFLSAGKVGMDAKWATVLAEAPYAPGQSANAPDVSSLTDAAEIWIRRHA